MAMTMADSIIRKACDRCHSQKLSCKRVGDEACERCVRLQTECKSSPSLRYKKQHQQHGQQYQRQQQRASPYQNPQQPQTQPSPYPTPGSKPPIGRRSPKRRRTAWIAINQQAEDTLPEKQSVVATEAALEPADFDFSQIENLNFFSPPPAAPLSHNPVPGALEAFQPVPTFPDPWDQQLSQATETFHATSTSFQPGDNSGFPSAVPTLSLIGSPHSQTIAEKRRRPRLRNRPRQIALRQIANAPAIHIEPPGIHWMAQLSEINSRLLDLASVLPQQTGACNFEALGRSSEDAFSNQGFPIDEMFKLTRRVADVLDRLSAGGNASAGRMDSSDPGNSMFVLSIYVRLLDMYQKVFSLVRMELSQADAEAAFRFWRLPDVQVGSFAVDPSPSLQMSLTVQLAEEFLARLRVATAALDPALSNGGGSKGVADDGGSGKSMFSDVVDISFRAVKTKEESLGKHLAELRDEIEAFLNP
ncbi:Zn(2)-C6 fungal-type DNA-binding domain protein [Metarhizium album ARSEF 1941]|uniref:Zn(2)-C6 fungal-type DNA-binding domain protein n=1 Tax=Metarhizium album (strain ARSEF 1941) TaxID=1081103 RepID=A0A0B2WKT3_METAS|nr:Zn(2)-C6 fungal-type DNA-binding domain protein [Metarhizium album ARSEF 1941]KHN94244.1 Zn(2)-C6 fungal-type DNA-binding domain protein [Metarhizium album ARSEF 1941]